MTCRYSRDAARHQLKHSLAFHTDQCMPLVLHMCSALFCRYLCKAEGLSCCTSPAADCNNRTLIGCECYLAVERVTSLHDHKHAAVQDSAEVRQGRAGQGRAAKEGRTHSPCSTMNALLWSLTISRVAGLHSCKPLQVAGQGRAGQGRAGQGRAGQGGAGAGHLQWGIARAFVYKPGASDCPVNGSWPVARLHAPLEQVHLVQTSSDHYTQLLFAVA